MRTTTTPRVRTGIVDQHATWIAVNPVQGCPKSCRYCFLHERGQAGVAPETLADPASTVELLLTSPLYAPTRPVAPAKIAAAPRRRMSCDESCQGVRAGR